MNAPVYSNAQAGTTQKKYSSNHTPISTYIENTIRHYFSELEGDMPTDLYNLVLREVEKPMLKVVLEATRGNQSKTAEVLGLSRGTLRKKMASYDML